MAAMVPDLAVGESTDALAASQDLDLRLPADLTAAVLTDLATGASDQSIAPTDGFRDALVPSLDAQFDAAVDARSSPPDALRDGGIADAGPPTCSVRFAPPVMYQVPSGGPRYIALADFDDDGNVDIATLAGPTMAPLNASDTLVVFYGRVDGTLMPPMSWAIAQTVEYGLAAGDFNGDSHPDVVTVGENYGCFMLNDGHGGFRPAGILDYWNLANINPLNGYSVAAADFNRDGRLDVLMGTFIGPPSISSWLGHGDRSAAVHWLIDQADGIQGNFLLTGDFDDDGIPDFLAGELIPVDGFSVWLGNGDGTFARAHDYPADPNGFSWLVAGDYDEDGQPDVIVGNNTTDLLMFPGQRNGSFSPPDVLQNVAQGGPRPFAAADFNHDGHLDVLVESLDDTVLLGDGKGHFSRCPTAIGPSVAVVADLNHDGKSDILLYDGDMFTLLLNETP